MPELRPTCTIPCKIFLSVEDNFEVEVEKKGCKQSNQDEDRANQEIREGMDEGSKSILKTGELVNGSYFYLLITSYAIPIDGIEIRNPVRRNIRDKMWR